MNDRFWTVIAGMYGESSGGGSGPATGIPFSTVRTQPMKTKLVGMTDLPEVSGIQEFSAPDEKKAVAVAEALSTFGFERVVAQPLRWSWLPDSEPVSWRILALDPGPYADGKLGDYAIGIVGQTASSIAGRLGARWARSSRCHLDEFDQRLGAGEHLTFSNTGARPPLPAVEITVRPAPIGFNSLDDVGWGQLSHAYGSAEDIPDLLRELLEDHWNWNRLLNELFFSYLIHQGTCYSASAPALSFAAQLTEPGTLPADQRRIIYEYLFAAALDWTERQEAAIRGNDAELLGQDSNWAQAVHDSIGAELPSMLRRWEVEPPENKYVLAILAALFPDTGRSIAQQVQILATEAPDPQQRLFLRLSAALIRGNDSELPELIAEVSTMTEKEFAGTTLRNSAVLALAYAGASSSSDLGPRQGR
ncbi:hypothetical protein [Nocardia seriolae]|uniref:hypothetical protein n=2 Tax=Nocardia seriolae TaxID=37332 RepID=UPI001313E7B9|nr:hypothetical protein [Nocardia seriolae]QUN17056.1 hypothetical protein KEC46_33690 [Nocardia seriolae]WKY55829.1 hypothetical protein Q5P07_18505 [Nocardia seriolae]